MELSTIIQDQSSEILSVLLCCGDGAETPGLSAARARMPGIASLTGGSLFSGAAQGGRSCVGVRFANAEARIALIRLYQNFTLRLLPGQDPLETTTQITMSPKHGVKVTVHARS